MTQYSLGSATAAMNSRTAPILPDIIQRCGSGRPLHRMDPPRRMATRTDLRRVPGQRQTVCHRRQDRRRPRPPGARFKRPKTRGWAPSTATMTIWQGPYGRTRASPLQYPADCSGRVDYYRYVDGDGIAERRRVTTAGGSGKATKRRRRRNLGVSSRLPMGAAFSAGVGPALP